MHEVYNFWWFQLHKMKYGKRSGYPKREYILLFKDKVLLSFKRGTWK